MENGAIWKVSDSGVEPVGRIDPKILFVDSLVETSHDFHTMRRRQKIGDSGMALIDGVFDSKKLSFVQPLEWRPSGLPLAKAESWQEDLT